MRRRQAEVVTFKADDALLEAMQGIPNRSEFIRNAVLHALESLCPVCKGSGILTPNQKRHWDAFARDHKFKECDDCHEYSLVCGKSPRRRVRHHHGEEVIYLDMSKNPDDTPDRLAAGRRVRVVLEDAPTTQNRPASKAAGK